MLQAPSVPAGCYTLGGQRQSMPTPYENVYIGAFILALGHKMGREMPDAHPLASVNLYQQTPADALLGDLLVDLSGLSILLEFKRNWRQTPSEVEKYLEVDFREEVERCRLREVANSCHFVGFSVPHQGCQTDLAFCSYLSLWDPARGDEPPESSIRFEQFLAEILSGGVGVQAVQLRTYIELLSGRAAGGAACLVVNSSREYGVRLFIVDEIRMLEQTRAELQRASEAYERERRQQEPPDDLRIRVRQ
jgi:hypothetical protein